ncbi:hypothetical protein SAMN05216338_103549 [Bradyrhizobium sp. Rc2d]|nr:hypothetical protein SAMN05216338_103549 [Bradyrhizobium sp. Rc2d]
MQVDDIVNYLRGVGIQDEIFFFPTTKLDIGILKGEIERLIDEAVIPPKKIANIYSAEELHTSERRLVEGKELLHLLDEEHFRVHTFEKLEKLIEQIVIEPGSKYSVPEDETLADIDRRAIIHALAVLFPFAVRAQLVTPYKAGKISLQEIVELVDLPLEHVQAVMDDRWEHAHKLMIRPQRSAGPERVAIMSDAGHQVAIASVPIGQDPKRYAEELSRRMAKSKSGT